MLRLIEAGHDPVVVDDFSRGTTAAVSRVEELTGRHVPVHAYDVADIDMLERLFDAERFDAVVHLAGVRTAHTSVARPLHCYETNLTTTFTLLRCMAWYGVPRLVLSSSGRVYDAVDAPAHEDSPLAPIAPLGRAHLMNEQVLRDVAGAAEPSLRVGVLRCATVVGPDPSGRLGDDLGGTTRGLLHAITQVAQGRRDHLDVFGGDYPTPDGTAVRDYVHVTDVAAAHVAALEALDDVGRPLSTWNVGSGRPTSVLSLVGTFEAATGRTLPYRVLPRRPGDAAVSYLDVSRAGEELGWTATRGLPEICTDHWRWQRRNPEGYPLAATPETPWRGGVGHRLRLLQGAENGPFW
ncbi:UDP-glucose 4-epimerase GalE [Isoptericola variabilis]|uniref:UDP-glucose 4-epimerase GalE n=1 Tax=Isoptericola variabilis TaxID=139208 RepID=UPI0002EF5FCD|nr:UDP-glucose 4-epimerase GalE [Isoptericola variabilis]